MFKITTSETFKWPVEVRIPTDGGRHQTAVFDAVFRRLTQPEIDGMADRLMHSEGAAGDSCRSIMVGWDGVEDDSGPVPFSQDALERMLKIPGLSVSILRTYFEASRGLERKN